MQCLLSSSYFAWKTREMPTDAEAWGTLGWLPPLCTCPAMSGLGLHFCTLSAPLGSRHPLWLLGASTLGLVQGAGNAKGPGRVCFRKPGCPHH